MKRLTLLRHAQADNPLAGQQDWDRPLTKRGERDAGEMARRMKALHQRPVLILSSPAVRARQTAEAFRKCFTHAELRFIDELYLAAPRQLLSVIHEAGSAATHLLVVAHNPGIGEFADQLSQDRRVDSMPTGATVSAEFDLDDWRDLQPGSGANVEFDCPQRSA